jgi:extracellular factor (EF) 3-hydroxypalmitic acid methyl ester biosynthesis protein
MIQKVYNKYTNPDPFYFGWDNFFQQQAAPVAVRNRRVYLTQKLAEKIPERVLILSHGPATEVSDYFCQFPNAETKFMMQDSDPKAALFVNELISIPKSKIQLSQASPYKMNFACEYDMIYCAGMFDYITNKHFLFLTRKYFDYLKPGGIFIIGNFSPVNPSKKYMEIIGDWKLNYRTPDELMLLANSAIIQRKKITIEADVSGVDLFLHIQKI